MEFVQTRSPEASLGPTKLQPSKPVQVHSTHHKWTHSRESVWSFPSARGIQGGDDHHGVLERRGVHTKGMESVQDENGFHPPEKSPHQCNSPTHNDCYGPEFPSGNHALPRRKSTSKCQKASGAAAGQSMPEIGSRSTPIDSRTKTIPANHTICLMPGNQNKVLRPSPRISWRRGNYLHPDEGKESRKNNRFGPGETGFS